MADPITVTCVHEDGTEHPADLDADGFATLPCPRVTAEKEVRRG